MQLTANNTTWSHDSMCCPGIQIVIQWHQCHSCTISTCVQLTSRLLVLPRNDVASFHLGTTMRQWDHAEESCCPVGWKAIALFLGNNSDTSVIEHRNCLYRSDTLRQCNPLPKNFYTCQIPSLKKRCCFCSESLRIGWEVVTRNDQLLELLLKSHRKSFYSVDILTRSEVLSV